MAAIQQLLARVLAMLNAINSLHLWILSLTHIAWRATVSAAAVHDTFARTIAFIVCYVSTARQVGSVFAARKLPRDNDIASHALEVFDQMTDTVRQ